MKIKNLFICVAVFFYHFSFAQNVGVNKPNPQETLDVGGNVNVDGTIKASGVDGTPGQVLMKNSGGDLTWSDISKYKNILGFSSASSTISNTNYTWNVPPTVTKIFVEAWGAGGGGAIGGGGGGGGYIAGELNVTPGAMVNIIIGASGLGATSDVTNGAGGNNTTVTISPTIMIAYGGGGGYTNGGGFPGRFMVNTTSIMVYGQSGSSGEATNETYGQYNSSIFYTATQFGSGGQGGNTLLPNKNGGYRSFNTATSSNLKLIYGQIGAEPSGGGGGQSTGGKYGGPGMVIIHY